jgi:hypothetical protein
VRLLARWSAACHAAFRACLLATNSGLTAPLKGGVTCYTRPFGDRPRMAFLHFRAPVRATEKGLLCLKRS